MKIRIKNILVQVYALTRAVVVVFFDFEGRVQRLEIQYPIGFGDWLI